MNRNPIVLPGQVYLHSDVNEYVVVTKSNQGHIQFAGKGIIGVHDIELFLERFGPVDPTDLTSEEKTDLSVVLSQDTVLSTGYVKQEDEAEFDNEINDL
jgi:hypothetical protein